MAKRHVKRLENFVVGLFVLNLALNALLVVTKKIDDKSCLLQATLRVQIKKGKNSVGLLKIKSDGSSSKRDRTRSAEVDYPGSQTYEGATSSMK